MSEPSVGFDIFQALDIACCVALQVSLDLEALDELAKSVLLIDCQILGLDRAIYFGFEQNVLGSRSSNAVNSSQREFESFVFW
jgi:hypothetical protein